MLGREDAVRQLLAYSILRPQNMDVETGLDDGDEQFEQVAQELWRQCRRIERQYVDQMQEEARQNIPLAERYG